MRDEGRGASSVGAGLKPAPTTAIEPCTLVIAYSLL